MTANIVRQMRRLLAVAIAVVALSVPATAEAGAGGLEYLLGEALGPGWSAAISYASDGSSIEVSGNGTFSRGGASPDASGGGTYIVRDGTGTAVNSGQWTLTRFGGFTGYGCVEEGGETLCGGELRAEVDLGPLGTGRMWIVCLGPEAPPSARGGVRIHAGSLLFDEKDEHSPAVFIRAA